MTDRELLEQAATAYFGADGFEWNSCAGFSGCIQYIPNGLTHYVEWNPLADDGDALRLAVKLRITPRVHLQGYSVAVTAQCIVDSYTEICGDDEMAATRRAIVRAAAEIGRAMP